MAAIRPLDVIAKKWTTVTPLRAEEYKFGIENPKKNWEEEAVKANDTYVKAVTAAAQAGRYAGGIKKAGLRKWQDRATKKGPGRFSEGVMIAGPDYEEGFAPFHAEIERVDLPPKRPKGDPGNINRCAVIAKALHEKKLALRK